MLILKKSKLLAFCFTLLFTCFINKQIKAQCHIDDWTALKALYESTDGDNWKRNNGWQEVTDSTKSANCNLVLLQGVGLNEQGRVNRLSLSFNQLSGNIPPELGRVSNLSGLYLDNNQLNGSLPAELGNLNNLTILYLNENNLSGSIPAELGNLSELYLLNIEINDLNGSIPTQIGNLNKLRELYLTDNQLSGSIPTELGKLSNLEKLFLDYNQLNGSLPAELGNLSNLTVLYLKNNQLSGSIPSELENLNNIIYLHLQFNQFSGSIPSELTNLNNLVSLNLGDNNLSGCYQQNLTVLCSKLAYDNITEGNNFYADWGDFCDKQAGICFENKPKCNNDDWFALKDFYTKTNGINWKVNDGWEEVNGDKSTASCDLGNLFGIQLDNDGRVSEIDLSNNNLSGDISTLLVDLKHLKTLKIADNNLSGCYHPNLKQLCTHVSANNEDISAGNNLNATWEDFCTSNAGVCTKCHMDDWTALKALYESTNGDNWNYNKGWREFTSNTPSTNCNLKSLIYVFVNEQSRVESLFLRRNGLYGSIPAEIGSLSYLKSLILGENSLKGNIPAQLGNLSNLTSLELASNQLSGNIPTQLGNLSNLTSLELTNNQLDGSIPAQLGNLNNLELFYLKGNNLSGNIPAQLGNLINLDELYLENNQLIGNIPAELGNLSSLKRISLGDNQLSGSIPAKFGNLDSLRTLYLAGNNLSGCYERNLTALCSRFLPPDYAAITDGNNFYADWGDFCDNEAGICFKDKPNCSKDDWFTLKDFYSKTNGINWNVNEGWEEVNGNKSTASCDLSNLFGIQLNNEGRVSEIDLSNNNLTGDIIALLVNLTHLKTLKIADNHLSGCYHPNLKQLCTQVPANNEAVSAGNNLTASWEDFCTSDAGVCTKCHIDDWTALKAFYESTNGDNWRMRKGWQEFSGTIPSANCNLKLLNGVYLNENGRVDSLILSYNQLSGNLPAQIGNLSNLTFLFLLGNQLNGNIPAEIGKLKQLKTLMLYNNQLSGIPAQMGNLSSLIDLDLGFNQLSGNIPPQMGNLNSLINLNLAHNQLSGKIPPQLGNLNSLIDLDLGNNQLSGNIPDQLGDLSSLSTLSLEVNQLSGSIPAQIGNLSNLKRLYLGYNRLNGSIPAQLDNLGKLDGLYLESNQLSGNIPIQLGNLSTLLILSLGNNQLNGNIPAQLSNLSYLASLDLSGNQLNGNLPAQLGSLSNLRQLYLEDNQLSGNLPVQLGSLTNLEELHLEDNQLSGNFPKELGNLSELYSFTLNSNYFSCQDIESVFYMDTTLRNFKYSPQLYKPTNYDSISINIFDSISINHQLAVDIPFDTTGFTYQWLRNGAVVPSANQATLNFDTIQPKNAGEYTLQLINENCLPGDRRFTTESEPIYIILKGYDLYGKPVEYDQIMVEFDNEEDTKLNEDEILTPNAGWVKKACNCSRELYLWQFPNTEAASKALIEIDKKTKRTIKKSKITGGFNNLVKIEEAQNSSLAYKVLSETLQMDYPDSVIVYILDSGLDDQNLDADASFTVNNAPIDSCYAVESQIGYSYVDSTNSTIPVSNNYQDELWHGTYGFHSITENLNENHKIKVIPLKTFDKNGNGNLFDMTCALHHAINHNADVINISAGYQGQPSAILEAAINEARKKGIFITAAAGNDSINIDTLAQYPAYYASQYNRYETVDAFGNVRLDSIKYDNVISIASINENDNISSFSNVGKQSVTMAAYGENIHGYGLGNDEIVALGTSMSTYFVTKELALEIAANKNRTYQQIWNDFKQNRLVPNDSLEGITQTGKQLKVKLEVASITGCTNPDACNYFEYATIDDGTCQFAAYHPSDLTALKALYVGTNGNNWKRNDHWETLFQDTLSSPCTLNELYGVWLNEAGRVYRINLYNNNLNGQIPLEIEGLTELNELYLAANNLSGEIPVALTKLDKITALVLSANYLGGNIPLEMAELYELKRLNLSYNQLGGEMPPQLGQLNQLKYLKLNNNKLIGNIPDELAQLKNLYLLNISNNLLSGCFENNLEQLCNQKWSPLFKGNANISNGNSFDATWENFCSNKEGVCESINRLNDKPKMFSLYPNPSEGKLFMKFSTTEYKNNTLKISNLEGKCILKIEGKHISDNTFEMDLGDLPKGMYILELQNEHKNYAEKFILK